MSDDPSAPVAEGSGEASLTDAFLVAFRHHPAGVAVITADSADGPVALTVSSLISISAAPPTVAFSLSNASSSARTVRQAGTIVVHLVRRENMQLARLCATGGADRFGPGVRWERLPTGEPYYPEVNLWFRASITGELVTPGACLVTAELLSVAPGATEARREDTLVYANRTWHGVQPIADAGRAPLLLWPDDSATF